MPHVPRLLLFILVFPVLLARPGMAQPRAAELPKLIRTADRADLIVDGRPFLMLGGELRNSSSSSVEFMEPIWDHLVSLHVSTVFLPVSWMDVEPLEGEFNFSLVRDLVLEARKRKLRLVLLWFGSWKNGESSYAPSWVMTQPARFLRTNKTTLSPFGVATRQADTRAFAALMRQLRELDGEQHTVIMVQVENEVGLLGDSRDRCAAAERAFQSPVPAQLIDNLRLNEKALKSFVRDGWVSNGRRLAGTWSQVFGAGDQADEIFMAWHMASFVNAVAQAGKDVYPLPMIVNPWTVDANNPKPGVHPSGGPVDRVMDIWMAAAPAIDVFAVDSYRDFKRDCKDYRHRGNPLFIPEAGGWWAGDDPASTPAKAFYAFGEGHALCFSPFGIDNQMYQGGHLLGLAYQKLQTIAPLILEHRGTRRMRGFYRSDKEAGETFEFEGYRATVKYSVDQRKQAMFDEELRVDERFGAFGLIIQSGPDEFLVAGRGCQVTFSPQGDGEIGTQIIEDGEFVDGKWKTSRVLNGDEIGQGLYAVNLPPSSQPVIGEPQLSVVKVRIYPQQ